MIRRLAPVLSDILETIERIEAATADKTAEDFKADWVLKLAIQRALEIISEASRHIPDQQLAMAPEIPWKQIRDMGNILRHEYHRVADDIVWAVVRDNMAPLKIAVLAMQAGMQDTGWR